MNAYKAPAPDDRLEADGQKPDDRPTYPYAVMERITKTHVCARCHGELSWEPVPGHYGDVYIVCPTCEDAWHGARVTRRYVEEQRQQAIADYQEVKRNPALRDILPAEPKKTEEELLKGLGY